MEGYRVVRMEDVVGEADIVVTATGNMSVVTQEHVLAMKDHAILCNIGHFDTEIQVEALREFPWTNIKPQVDLIHLPNDRSVVLLSEGRLVNLGNATGHSSFVMSTSFTNQVLAQLELWQHHEDYKNEVTVLPRHLDEEVARLHLGRIGARLDGAVRRPGRLPRRGRRGALQGGELPVLRHRPPRGEPDEGRDLRLPRVGRPP